MLQQQLLLVVLDGREAVGRDVVLFVLIHLELLVVDLLLGVALDDVAVAGLVGVVDVYHLRLFVDGLAGDGLLGFEGRQVGLAFVGELGLGVLKAALLGVVLEAAFGLGALLEVDLDVGVLTGVDVDVYEGLVLVVTAGRGLALAGG